MSGHSKWSSIKHKKGAADAKRGQLFSKLSRALIIASRDGGARPGREHRARQRDREGARGLHAEGQHRARDRAGAGTDGEGDAYETVSYEGYGPTGVAILVEAVTDNRNRTAADVRHIFAKNDGNLGATGAVAWLFERKGVAHGRRRGVDEDDVMLAAAEGGAEDIERTARASASPRAGGSRRRCARRSRRAGIDRRVGRADDGAEDDRGGGGRGDAPARSSA